MTPHNTVPIRQMLSRAILEKCPNCGSSPLFKSYLKQVDSCAVCNENFANIRADDAPPWLTILIVGHILVPLLVFVQPKMTWPDWVALPCWFILTIALALVILPRAKAFFIAVIWRTQTVKKQN